MNLSITSLFGLTGTSPLKRAKQQLHDTEMERLESSRMAEYYNAMTDMLAERKDRLELYIDTYGKTADELEAMFPIHSSKFTPTTSEIDLTYNRDPNTGIE